MKKFLLLIVVFIMSILTCFAQEELTLLPSQKGVVEEIEYIDLNDSITQTKQNVLIKLKNKETINIENMLTGNPFYDIKLKKGTKVILHAETDGENIYYSIENISRSGILIWLSLIFCGLLI